MAKGQIQYQDRLNELRVLKIKLGDLKRELGVLKHSVGSIDVLKREVHRLGKELLQERTKTKALTEELENPSTCTGGGSGRAATRPRTR